MAKPITPKEAAAYAFIDSFPEAVVDAFNYLIKKNLRNGEAIVMQDEVADKIAKRLMISRDEVFKRRYLDVESVFREAGWIVYYEKPSFGETHKPFFKFSYSKDKKC